MVVVLFVHVAVPVARVECDPLVVPGRGPVRIRPVVVEDSSGGGPAHAAHVQVGAGVGAARRYGLCYKIRKHVKDIIIAGNVLPDLGLVLRTAISRISCSGSEPQRRVRPRDPGHRSSPRTTCCCTRKCGSSSGRWCRSCYRSRHRSKSRHR